VKNILCYGDSNTWGCIPLEGPAPARRFPPTVRWPGVLRRELGDGYWVVEEGLNGRTTVWNDELEPHRNGRKLLLPTLLTHRPLELVIVMLGTNDLKRRIGVSAREIAEGAGMLADIVAGSGCGPDDGAPQVLVVCPPRVGRVDQFADEFEGAPDKSQVLSHHFAAIAEARSCAFLDAGAVVSSSDIDGIHLDESAHARLGVAIAEHVRQLVGYGMTRKR
jgi:lysophospholipase L1-like esterase